MDRLIVKNFGPLKDINIKLNEINLFIGENGSGKSVLGKLITILYNIYNNMNLTMDNIIKSFDEYKINYLSKDTIIELTGISNDNKIENMITIKNLEFQFGSLMNNFKNNYSKLQSIKNHQEEEINKFTNYLKTIKKLNNEKKLKYILKKLETINNIISKFNKLQSRYIPSERNFISIISQSLSSFIVADIPLPKYLLQFSSDFENATNQIQELNILNIKYIYDKGLDRHKIYYDDQNYLLLNESSSGIQAVIPLLITYKYFTEEYHSIVIEEPEQNLFPKAQKEVIDFIIENLQKNNQLFLMTHSPYILTALNNLILAHDVKTVKGEEAIKGLVKSSQCIPFEEINAYYIENGKAIDIMDKENRLIGINIIDEISDEVNETFDILLSKLD